MRSALKSVHRTDLPGFARRASPYGSGRSATYTYQDNRGWLMGVEARNGATSLMNQTYTRKANGQISTVTMAGDVTRSWTYL